MATKKTVPSKVPKAVAGETAAGSNKPIDSIKHKAQRVHIPSREEAGQEADALQGSPTVKSLTLNPVTHRGQDPELYWMHKYSADDAQTSLNVDIRSLYRHEHIAPEKIISRLYSLKGRTDAQNELFTNQLFGNPLAMDELDKPLSYYKQADKWQNRLVQGDSLLVMTSLLEREGMAGQVQCIYMDPPYGIKYGSNWQMRLGDRNVKDGADESLSGEPEVIKAFRDTWELGIHSYLSYLRDRLLVAKELLSASGSCFVQISDENVHLVRCLMDEVFGSENFVSQISFQKTGGATSALLATVDDYLIWYARDKTSVKFRPLFEPKQLDETDYDFVLFEDGKTRRLTREEKIRPESLPSSAKIYGLHSLKSSGFRQYTTTSFTFKGENFHPGNSNNWKTSLQGMEQLAHLERIEKAGSSIRYRRFFADNPVNPITNVWRGGGTSDLVYVVQTANKIIERCMLMTTDPGDIVLDPTCGSGTTAYIAEQWGRRWITSDTSRIALNIAKTRLMTATFPWYKLADVAAQDIRHGFVYKTVPHVTLKSLANNEPIETQTLFDQPVQDKKKLRVSGPFTVETLQSFEPLAPDRIAEANTSMDNVQRFIDRVFEHLKTAGIKNGAKNETAVFNRVDIINDEAGALHAEGWYAGQTAESKVERKAYLHIGPQFGTVSRAAVNAAIKACRQRADADWLVVLGFGFESDVDNRNVTLKMGSFEVTKVRMHDDLMQEGLIKKDKKAASFVTIGEPDIGIIRQGDQAQVEIRGLDIYDPVKDEVKGRSVADISYWMVDDAYDGSNFVATQVFFCGGEADEFDKFKRGLNSLAVASTKRNAERTLKIELDDEAFERVYGFVSHPIPVVKGKKIAVRVISQFGEESTKVITL
ncbi:MAG: site-specific DNA-methyltransferase [Xanthomonadaceae bacterium]|nr:site-specific DNA-methyltransferase [Xanthomonadaceae bacterium]